MSYLWPRRALKLPDEARLVLARWDSQHRLGSGRDLRVAGVADDNAFDLGLQALPGARVGEAYLPGMPCARQRASSAP
jgi:hypothetical protein